MGNLTQTQSQPPVFSLCDVSKTPGSCEHRTHTASLHPVLLDPNKHTHQTTQICASTLQPGISDVAFMLIDPCASCGPLPGLVWWEESSSRNLITANSVLFTV